MTIHIYKDGTVAWTYYRKAYRKARHRRAGQREINYILKNYPGYDALIIM